MSKSYTIKELAEELDISQRRVNQLVQKGILQRSPDGLFDKTCIAAYLRHLRLTIAHYSGKTRGKPSKKTTLLPLKPLTPEQKEANMQRLNNAIAEIEEMFRRKSTLNRRQQ